MNTLQDCIAIIFGAYTVAKTISIILQMTCGYNVLKNENNAKIRQSYLKGKTSLGLKGMSFL